MKWNCSFYFKLELFTLLRQNGKTAIMLAEENGHSQIVDLLQPSRVVSGSYLNK